jgi:uncharacterized protein with HEPN domain
MSKNPKSQLIYLLRILEYCGKIHLYLQNIKNSIEFFNKDDQLYFNACLNLLVQIGEQSNKIDELIKTESQNISWTMIKGFRNIAVHEYQFVDAEKVYTICSQHIHRFKIILRILSGTHFKKVFFQILSFPFQRIPNFTGM